jgi:cytochrome c2
VQADEKKLFISQCASRHNLIKNGTGPALAGIEERGLWHDRKKLCEYIRTPSSIEKSKYIDSLRKVYGSEHMAFPDLTDDEISAILEYINVDYTRPIVD